MTKCPAKCKGLNLNNPAVAKTARLTIKPDQHNLKYTMQLIIRYHQKISKTAATIKTRPNVRIFPDSGNQLKRNTLSY